MAIQEILATEADAVEETASVLRISVIPTVTLVVAALEEAVDEAAVILDAAEEASDEEDSALVAIPAVA